jgi:hypothetical protein
MISPPLLLAGCMAVLASPLLQGKALTLPVVLQPDRELEELYDYRPEYVPNVPTFDSMNRPYLRSRTRDINETGFIHTLRDGEWVKLDFTAFLKRTYPGFKGVLRGGGTTDVRVIFDSEDRFYTLLTLDLGNRRSQQVMLYSTDLGKSFGVVEIPAGAVPAEHSSGHNELKGPPFLMIGERVGDHPGRWARLLRLTVTQPRWEGERIVIPEPVEVSRMLVSLGQHSGGSTFAVTRAGKTHFVWAEVDIEDKAPGTPTFVATYDQRTGRVSKPLFIAHAPPLNNSHNMPGIVMDSRGFLHVVTGAHHGESFFYTRSLKPNDASGWTKPTPVLAGGWRALSGQEAGGQTYVSLVCDANDMLHLVFRHWQRGIEKYPHLAGEERDQLAALSYQQKPATAAKWSAPRTLIIPERGIYSIYNQKLSLDRKGRLFLTATYFDRVLAERSETDRFHRPMVMVSPDAGKSWRFAATEDFAR